MSAHPRCADGHVCQRPSGRTCVERGCDEPAGTAWGPLWCPEHDRERLDRVSAGLRSLVDGRPMTAAGGDRGDNTARRRFRECAEQFGQPDEYDPRCCRFPKSCSPYPYPEAIAAGSVAEEDLEPATDRQTDEERFDCGCVHTEATVVRRCDRHQALADRAARPTHADAVMADLGAAITEGVTEVGLRDALRTHHPIMRSETGPFSGCRCGGVKLGQDVIAHVVTELRAALGGEG